MITLQTLSLSEEVSNTFSLLSTPLTSCLLLPASHTTTGVCPGTNSCSSSPASFILHLISIHFSTGQGERTHTHYYCSYLQLAISPPPSLGQLVPVKVDSHLTLTVEGVVEHGGKRNVFFPLSHPLLTLLSPTGPRGVS